MKYEHLIFILIVIYSFFNLYLDSLGYQIFIYFYARFLGL